MNVRGGVDGHALVMAGKAGVMGCQKAKGKSKRSCPFLLLREQ